MIKRIWNKFWGPAGALSLGVLLIGGFVAGIIFWGGFHTAMEATNEMEFCISCHEMRDNVYKEYVQSPHYMNASGVGAVCADCHVPKKWLPKMIRKVQASGELYGHFVTGVIDTPEKFEAHRAELAQSVWATMEANDSLECRNCHAVEHMDFEQQSPNAAKLMQAGIARGDTCIDCHKGIAHKLPDLSQGFRKKFEELEEVAAKGVDGDNLYPLKTIPLYGSAENAKAGEEAIGQVLAATHLKVEDRDKGMVKVSVEGWQQDGVGQVVYALRGQRIFEATVKKSAVDRIEIHGTETDPDTDLVWHKVSLSAWVAPEDMIADIEPLWDYTSEMYTASCGVCHSKPEPSHSLSNQWIGTLKAMKRFITLDKEEYRLLQKYLQLHAKDTGGAHHD
ncbi:pentaheme c-type cytochrome TorC [Vannielia sp.]|uniref:pentaheme c-type cytochrome TorC n=1 Tax=Vannielia sp. TaxID=2813045 RepID=UPI002619EFFD|nr:pentaheme c-type cytochrome TorC [Vannielia sp.]MDF1872850.1 pentaheme c-type cytochrome TorC [Vannielia sp.]